MTTFYLTFYLVLSLHLQPISTQTIQPFSPTTPKLTMTSHDVVELALRNRIAELKAELRETKVRYTALETKAKDNAKKLADIASIIQNDIMGETATYKAKP
ncbi:uncharacterized protein FSUBG_6860 [Fusarium subglutinans]|uniref:Uncharacterized protein n=1 Tax=Gibberella subglutinans TaxID=42677 RepID=A0A8H5PWZ9_GIBSU|nr:uncharacterized protein FSUBG_6860 [Fusarium subglutinans]KAF5604557.1 hypothetical protein FSUBG_6860 [Fusarium subglutinans]